MSNFEGLGLILVASKKISLRKIKAELLKQFVLSLKEVVFKYRANRYGMQK